MNDLQKIWGIQKSVTYEQIKAYVLEKYGLKVSRLYIAQMKRKCGIIERENYNKPKSENARQPMCPPEKEAAIRAAPEHFRMIECFEEPRRNINVSVLLRITVLMLCNPLPTLS